MGSGGPGQPPCCVPGAIADPDNDLAVSVASVWELSIKQRLGKLATALAFDEIVGRGLPWIRLLDIRLPHVRQAHELPLLHRDPFDRIIIAQAIVEGLTLLTVDQALSAYGTPILPAS